MKLYKESGGKKIKGVRIQAFNYASIVLSGTLYIVLFLITVSLSAKYSRFVGYVDEYVECERIAAQISEASDYLTEQVQLYVQNRSIKNAELYFEEANVSRRREKAMEEIKRYSPETENTNALRVAVACSDELMKREIYAMRLAAEAAGQKLSDLPEEVRNVTLSDEDRAINRAAMAEKARKMVFDDEYQNAKNRINENLSDFSESILENVVKRQNGSLSELSTILVHQRICIYILFVINILIFAAINLMIIKPLKLHSKNIGKNRLLSVNGAYEIKYLAETYNEIYKLNAEHNARLVEKNEHDSLTGILNRNAFNRISKNLTDSKVPLAIVFLDIDRFKQINDGFGHETGDRILKSASSLLTEAFRMTDYVIRLGGDEFVVIMPGISENYKDVIRAKFDRINEALKNPSDGLPPAVFSAGVAFSECGFTEDMLVRADSALYLAKNSGRSRCCFYNEREIKLKI